MALKNNFIDVLSLRYPKSPLQSQLKTLPPPGLSFLFNHIEKINDANHYTSLSDKWGITAFMDRKSPGGDDVMKYSFQGIYYPWKTMITLDLTDIENHAKAGTKLAKGFTKFCLDEKHNRPEKFTLRKVYYAENPKPLNYHLMEKYCVTMLKRMYGGEDASIKQELIEYGDLLINFLEVRRKVRKCWRLWTIGDYS